jgi:hypothetical protein
MHNTLVKNNSDSQISDVGLVTNEPFMWSISEEYVHFVKGMLGCIQNFPDWVDNKINNNNNNNKLSLRSNTKGYGGKPHWTDS